MKLAGKKQFAAGHGDFLSTPNSGLTRRFLSLTYEILLCLAIAFIASLAFPGAAKHALPLSERLPFQIYLLLVIGLYFIPCWRISGQTLPMKAWRIRVERIAGGKLEWWRAGLRYALACLSTIVLGLGFVWAFVDRDRQFLHDRLAKTRIVGCL